MNLAQHLEISADSYPNRPAIGIGAGVLHNYAGLAARVARLASSLRGDFGLAEGDRVAIVAGNTPDYVTALYAIWHAGLVGVPANAKLHGAELNYILEHSGARAAFVSPDLATVVEAHAPPSLEHIVVFGGRSFESLLAADWSPQDARSVSLWMDAAQFQQQFGSGVLIKHGEKLVTACSHVGNRLVGRVIVCHILSLSCAGDQSVCRQASRSGPSVCFYSDNSGPSWMTVDGSYSGCSASYSCSHSGPT